MTTMDSERLNNLRALVNFAFEQGFHELGYDPIAELADAVVVTTTEQGVTYDLQALRATAKRACNAALEHVTKLGNETIPGAINWGDLSCVAAERFETDGGATGFRVWLEEAAPASWELQQFVEKFLEEHGFTGVSVMTDW